MPTPSQLAAESVLRSVCNDLARRKRDDEEYAHRLAMRPWTPDDGTCQVWVYSGRGSGQVWTETNEGEGQRLDKDLVQLELGLIGFNDKGIKHRSLA